MKAIHYKADGTREYLDLTGKDLLPILQELVGGLIEVVYLRYPDKEPQDLIVNEEGLLLDLPLNLWSRYLSFGTNNPEMVLFGDVVLLEGVLP